MTFQPTPHQLAVLHAIRAGTVHVWRTATGRYRYTAWLPGAPESDSVTTTIRVMVRKGWVDHGPALTPFGAAVIRTAHEQAETRRRSDIDAG